MKRTLSTYASVLSGFLFSGVLFFLVVVPHVHGVAENVTVEAVVPSDDTAVCGNGILEDGEGCEDGNLTNGDGCNNVCELEGGTCGGCVDPPDPDPDPPPTCLGYTANIYVNSDNIIVGGTLDGQVYAGALEGTHSTAIVEVVVGTEGVDAIYPGRGLNIVCALGGDDSIFNGQLLPAPPGPPSLIFDIPDIDLLSGGDGNDLISGGRGQDIVYGGDGEDTILCRAQNTIYGGSGDDEITCTSGLGGNTIYGEGGEDIISTRGPNNMVRGGGSADSITLVGTFSGNNICGDAQDDFLSGGGGDDAIEGGPGFDTLDGNDGTDICKTGEILTECEDTTSLTLCAPLDPACGDGEVQDGEQCDDGDAVDGDGCSALCQLEECGNGTLDSGETCDDGNTTSGDGCSDVCLTETDSGPICGNGIVETGESCDDGNTEGGDGCSPTCGSGGDPGGGDPECGNGTVESGETCDDGNTTSGDGCDATCDIEDPLVPICGNFILESGEQCDDGNIISGDGCSASCGDEFPPAQCGNFIIEFGETCDDGNTIDGDGCSSTCGPDGDDPLSICGDGVEEGAEQCDDGNTTSGDGCSSLCQDEDDVVCGDSKLGGDETCDDGNTVNLDGCSSTCQIEGEGPVCGNDILETGEGCDDGNLTNEDGCSEFCLSEIPDPICGNDILEIGEQCDDGNTASGDGCSYICVIEDPLGPICGNDILEIGEQCDDGNTNGNDGCSRSCRIELPLEEEIETIIGIITSEDPWGTKISETTQILVDNAERLAQVLQVLANDPEIENLTEKYLAPSIATFVVVTLIPSLWSILLPLLRFLFLQPIFIFGKRRKEWGIVYNSLDKKPIDLAMVRLIEESSGRVIRSRVTDKEGRFLFIADIGNYLIEVVKDGFTFPSNILHSKHNDGRYIDLYFGEQIEVTDDRVDLTPNIPLDPEGEHKTPKRIRWSRRWNALQHLFSLLGIIASLVFLYVKPSIITSGLLIVHIILYILFFRFVKVRKPKSWGIVRSKKNEKPLKHAVARLFSKEYDKLIATEVTDRKGRYSFLAGNSDYYVTFEKKGFETEVKEISIDDAVGIVKEHVKLAENDAKGQIDASGTDTSNPQQDRVLPKESQKNKESKGFPIENSSGISIVEDKE